MNSKNLATRGKLLAGFVTLLFLGLSASAQSLTLAEVQTIIAQAVSQAVALNQKVTVSVTDNEGHLLGTFAMTDARDMTLVRSVGRAGQGLENVMVPARDACHIQGRHRRVALVRRQRFFNPNRLIYHSGAFPARHR
jgi:hypothetical protein